MLMALSNWTSLVSKCMDWLSGLLRLIAVLWLWWRWIWDKCIRKLSHSLRNSAFRVYWRQNLKAVSIIVKQELDIFVNLNIWVSFICHILRSTLTKFTKFTINSLHGLTISTTLNPKQTKRHGHQFWPKINSSNLQIVNEWSLNLEKTWELERWTSAFSRGPKLDSQHPHGSSRPTVILLPVYSVSSSGLCKHQTCTWYTDILSQNTLTHTKKFKTNNFRTHL